MRVLVTGANGHIGCNLVRELTRRGHTVVALVRPKADVRGLAGVPVEVAHGDVLEPDSVAAAAKGCEAIINLAAVYKLGADPATVMEPAVQGIRNVLQVAARQNVARVVHTSSTTAVGVCTSPDDIRDETRWNEHPIDAYFAAKTESERQAWALAKELSIPLVVVNPSGILGPWDYRMTPSSGHIEYLASGKGQSVVGGLNYVDVRDVAHIHAEALEKGTPGERYLCVSENLEQRDLAARVEALTGRRSAHVGLPRWVVLGAVGLRESVARLRGVEPEQTRSSVAEAVYRWQRYDGGKAQRAFGWKPRPVDEMLETALRWAIFVGRLPADTLKGDARPDPTWVK